MNSGYDKPDWMPEFCCKDFKHHVTMSKYYFYESHDIDIEDGNGHTVMDSVKFCADCGKKLI